MNDFGERMYFMKLNCCRPPVISIFTYVVYLIISVTREVAENFYKLVSPDGLFEIIQKFRQQSLLK